MNLETSPERWKEFIDSQIWKDMLSVLQMWLDTTRDDMETENDGRQFRVLQGRAAAIRDCMVLPYMLAKEGGEDDGSTG